jgi:hypothetical protein
MIFLLDLPVSAKLCAYSALRSGDGAKKSLACGGAVRIDEHHFLLVVVSLDWRSGL